MRVEERGCVVTHCSPAAVAADVATFHGWRTYQTDSGLNAYVFVAEQAVDREFHRTGCAELLAYYGLEA